MVGDLKTAVDAGREEAVVELAALRRQWGLKQGEAFRQPAWSDAKNTTLARLRADGYPAASWSTTKAQVDAEANTATLHASADSGALFHIGSVTVEGLQRYDETSVRRLSTFYLGDAYSEQALLDYQSAKREHKAEWSKMKAGPAGAKVSAASGKR